MLLASVAGGAAWQSISRQHRAARWSLPDTTDQLYRRAVHIPGGVFRVGSRESGCYPGQSVELPGFYLWPVEVPVSWWNAFRPDQPRPGRPDDPVSSVSYEEARAFCRWFSNRLNVAARLPTVAEWEVAARAGTSGMPYPWGWGLPAGRAVFAASSAAPVATLTPNPSELYDMSGNVAEWALAAEENTSAPVMGGSWAERDPRYLRISHSLWLPKSYRDRDVGFRIVIETPD